MVLGNTESNREAATLQILFAYHFITKLPNEVSFYASCKLCSRMPLAVLKRPYQILRIEVQTWLLAEAKIACITW